MSKQTTFKTGLAEGFSKKLNLAVNVQLETKASEIAQDAVMLSPVYSGAYVRSFSFKANNTSSRGRGQTAVSEKDNKSSSPDSEKQQGLSNLDGDISSIFSDPNIKIKTLTLRNDSPHAKLVEDGPIKTAPNGAKVFAQIRNKHG
jgi:hypothetical protein